MLYQADIIAGQGVGIVARSRAEIERSVTNVRDATDWGNKLVQKIYTNPFVLSPFYKPSNDDLHIQAVYDTAQVFTKGAQELNDAIKTLESVQAQVKTPRTTAGSPSAPAKALALTERLGQTSALLAEGLKRPADMTRRNARESKTIDVRVGQCWGNPNRLANSRRDNAHEPSAD